MRRLISHWWLCVVQLYSIISQCLIVPCQLQLCTDSQQHTVLSPYIHVNEFHPNIIIVIVMKFVVMLTPLLKDCRCIAVSAVAAPVQ